MDVSLVLTHDCNLACGYCYTGAKFRRRMPRETAMAGLDLAFEKKSEEVQLSYFGGEPTLEFDLLLEVAAEARSRAERAGTRLVQTVTTNGTLLDAEKIARLYELDLYVALSIDGVRAAHDANRPQMGGGSSFEAVEACLHRLVDAGRPFETISVVTPKSAPFLGASVEWLFEVGVPRVSLNSCYEAAWEEQDLAAWEAGLERAAQAMSRWMRSGRTVSVSTLDNKILAALKGGLGLEDKCKLGDGFVAISPAGHLYPCERLVAEDEGVADRVGHVTTGVARPKVECLRPDVGEDRHAVNEECHTCAERFRCSASCACANRAETGDMQVAGGVQCWHEKTSARIADRMAEALFAELDPVFLRWFYGRMGVDPVLLAEKIRSGELAVPSLSQDPRGIGTIARQKSGKRSLPVVRA